MSLIEITILLLMVLYSLILLIPGRKRPGWLSTVPAIIFIANMIQLFFYGFKWQLSLVYLLSLVFLVVSVKGLTAFLKRKETDNPKKTFIRITGMILGMVICYFSFKTLKAFPQFRMPEPTGEYAVGTKYYLFEDPGRESVYTDHASNNYRIGIQIWYPAEKIHSEPVFYQTKESSACIASLFDMPGFILNYLSKIKTHSFYNATLLLNDAPYPIVFYSPGGAGWINQTGAINEELASNGFVVISVGHESTEPFIRNENGDVIPLNMQNDYTQAISRELYSEAVENIKGRIINCENIEDKYELHKELNKTKPLNINDIKNRADNIYFIIDKLPLINREMSGISDTSVIGIYGFSKGGAVAGEVCVNCNTVKAGINLDGFMYGDIVEEPLLQPFMFVHSVSSDPQAYINDYFFNKAENDAYMMKIKGTTHANFGDLSLFGGIFKNRGVLGSINGKRAIEIQRAYVLAFFNRYLKDKNEEPLEIDSSEYHEVEIFRKYQK
jgi:hypothetical protein